MENKKSHWENVFATKNPNEVSWTQKYPKTSDFSGFEIMQIVFHGVSFTFEGNIFVCQKTVF